MRILVTGVAGFVGMHVAEALAARGDEVLGLDTGEDGIDPDLAAARLARLHALAAVKVDRVDLIDRTTLAAAGRDDVTAVVHLVASGSGRRGTAAHHRRLASRLEEHLVILDWCRDQLPALRHLVYAREAGEVIVSSPAFRSDAGEILGRAYARLHRLPQTGLRLHGAYGPCGRPDMPAWRVVDAIVAGRTVAADDAPVPSVHVDDVVAGVLAAIDRPPADVGEVAPHRVYDLAGPDPVTAARLVEAVSAALGLRPRQSPVRTGAPETPVDRPAAPDPGVAASGLGWRAAVAIEAGAASFVDWHRHWHARQ